MCRFRIGLVIAMASACGCYRSIRIPDASSSEDASVATDAAAPNDDASTTNPMCMAVESDAGVLVGRDVDLVLLIDNSSSMFGAQLALARELPRLVRGLVTGDSDGDPRTAPYVPVRSLRVAVITTDMGVLGVGSAPGESGLGGCGGSTNAAEIMRAYYGDDGIFVRTPNTQLASAGYDCDFDGDGVPDELGTDGSPHFLSFGPHSPGDELEARAACYAIRGTTGCGFEQHLEALLKATTPSSAPTRFHAAPGDVGRERGHGDDPLTNGGFLREDAILAVVVVSDEDDCSTGDPLMFDRQAPPPYTEPDPTGGTLNSRCVRFGDEPLANNPSASNGETISLVHPIARYAEGLLALKDDPRDIVFALIVGVPLSGTPAGTGEERLEGIDALLDPRTTPSMAIVLETGPTGIANARVRASCAACTDQNGNGRCDPGWNDVNQDGIDQPDCDGLVCDAGSTPRCTRDLDRDGTCDPEEVETSFVDLDRDFVHDPGEPWFPRERVSAMPPRRLLRMAREAGQGGAEVGVASICQNSFSDTIETILGDVRQVAVGTCD